MTKGAKTITGDDVAIYGSILTGFLPPFSGTYFERVF
jgi:hypothetical protein